MPHPASFRSLPARRASLLLAWFIASCPVSAQEDAVSLGDFLERVLTYNEQLQVQLLEYEVSALAVQGAKGVFEPEVVLRAQYDDTFRPNNAEELRNLGGLQFFQQRQWLYSAAVETLTTSGARARIGLDVRNINNNLQPFRSVDHEWSSFFGLSIVQPLLKGAGKSATLAAIRVASLESDQAYQEFRRQSMVILVGAEVAYVAPFSGVVADLYGLEVGEGAELLQPVVRLVDTSRVVFTANVPATAVQGLAPGAKVSLQIGQESCEGVVRFISPVLDPSSGLLTIKVAFENNGSRVRPGATGQLRFIE